MLYLLLAICSSAMISMVMRISEKYISNNLSMTAVNYAICAVMAALYTGAGGSLPAGEGGGFALWLGIASGGLYLASLLLLQWNVANNGVVLSATFMKLGVLVPTVLSFLLFRERLSLLQLLGFACALGAILLIHFDGGGGRAGNRMALIILLLGGGFTDFTSKIFEVWGSPAMKDRYLFYTFLTALVISIGLILMKKQRLGLWELLFGALVGVPNYLCSRFLLLSLDTVPAVIAFPTYSVGTIALVTCAGVFLFRESVSRCRGVALGVIMAALVLLNL